MSKLLRIYYYSIFGAMGGLTGWFLKELIASSQSASGPAQFWILLAVSGGVIGACVGAAIHAADGVVSQSSNRAVRDALWGAVFGMCGGAIALPFAEVVFKQTDGGLVGRALGWAIFGSAIGIAETVRGGAEWTKGYVGGCLGGCVGGLLCQSFQQSSVGSLWGEAMGQAFNGLCVGGFIALVTTMLMAAWIEVANGKMAGKVYDLSKYIYSIKQTSSEAVIGSDDLKADIYILADQDVALRHAAIKREDEHHVLRDLGSGAGTFVNGRPITTHRLADGNRIRVGKTELLYRERRGAQEEESKPGGPAK